MTKPKTGKMTEIEEELLETLNKIDSEETRNIIIGYVEALRTQYKEQGIAEGRDETYNILSKDIRPIPTSDREKQAYAKGRTEKITELKKEIEEGIYEKLQQEELDTWKKVKENAVADLKARLMSKEVMDFLAKSLYCDTYTAIDEKHKNMMRVGIRKIIEQALAEATKEGEGK